MATARGFAFVDGVFSSLAEARVPITDRGFLFADSVFETVRTYQRKPFLLGDHLDRLRRSADTLQIPVPWSDQHFGEVVAGLLSRGAQQAEAVLRIMVTRGDGGHGLAFPEPQRSRLVVFSRPLPALDSVLYREGVKVVLPEAARHKGQAVPADVKSGSYLAAVLALAEARLSGGFEALLRASDGAVSEATTSNVFVVRDGVLMTPGLSDHILPGITRALVLSIARSRDLKIVEEPIYESSLLSADEVFLTSSIKEVLPVNSVGDKAVGSDCPGPITVILMDAFAAQVEVLSRRGVARLSEL
ncbi:MAG: branched-chain amino acid aminotransferase [Rickettsiales bacterium]|nr:branched-chain amino acid aminotransferase [Rickettsiales bacterium]